MVDLVWGCLAERPSPTSAEGQADKTAGVPAPRCLECRFSATGLAAYGDAAPPMVRPRPTVLCSDQGALQTSLASGAGAPVISESVTACGEGQVAGLSPLPR